MRGICFRTGLYELALIQLDDRNGCIDFVHRFTDKDGKLLLLGTHLAHLNRPDILFIVVASFGLIIFASNSLSFSIQLLQEVQLLSSLPLAWLECTVKDF